MSSRGETKTSAVQRRGTVALTVILPNHEVLVLPVPTSGKVVIGRAADCDIVIDDESLSRNHAALWVFGEEYAIEDLASRNGTWVGEARVDKGERRRVRVGETMSVGSATLLLREVAVTRAQRRVLAHGQLELFLESECARAAAGGCQPFCLVRIELGERVARDVALTTAAEQACARTLQAGDLFAQYSPGVYEALLLGAAAEAPERVEALRAALADVVESPRVGAARYPVDGRSADELVAASVRALVDGGVASVEPVVRGTLGEVEPAVKRIAGSDINVIITGETGAGKDVVAQTLHRLSSRAKKPLVSLNCAAFGENLLEAELFGYERGAFTGAVGEKIGLLESADGGTVFLDEIAEMPLPAQAKLLRVVETKQVLRIGALRPRTIDVRFLAATHRDLETEIAAGRFREDLWFRLNGISLVVSPLRERVHEIEPLAELFLAQAAARSGLAAPALPEETRALLRAYRWPGNVRELRNVIERALVLTGDGVIRPTALPLEKMRTKTVELGVPARSAPASAIPDRRATAGRSVEREQERPRIVEALGRANGNQEEAARLLGISRRTLINRMDEYALPRPRRR